MIRQPKRARGKGEARARQIRNFRAREHRGFPHRAAHRGVHSDRVSGLLAWVGTSDEVGEVDETVLALQGDS